MAPFDYEKEEEFAPGIIKYTNLKFYQYKSEKIWEEVFYYKNAQTFWIPETDETLEWNVL